MATRGLRCLKGDKMIPRDQLLEILDRIDTVHKKREYESERRKHQRGKKDRPSVAPKVE